MGVDRKLSSKTETSDPTGGFVHIIKSLVSYKISVVNLVTSLFTSKAKVSAADTTENYLTNKITVTTNLLKAILNPAGDEQVNLDIAATIAKAILFSDTTQSTSPVTGAVKIAGGLGVIKDIVGNGTLNLINIASAQWSGAASKMYASDATLGNNAGVQFGAFIIDAGITESQFAIDAVDKDGVYHHNLMVININDKSAKFYGQVVGGSVTESFSATPTFNMNNGNTQQMTLTGNVTSLTLSNKVAGSSYLIYLVQDGTGSRTIPAPDSTFGTETDNSVSAFITALDDINIINVNVMPDGTTFWTLETVTA